MYKRQFAGFAWARDINGVPYVTEQCAARFACTVVNEVDLGTHIPVSYTHLDVYKRQELLRESGKNDPAELALFVVSPSCRGQGVGKALFQAALDYTGQQKLDEIYLFTDTSCNYGFYEHQGMRRRCEKEHLFHINGKAASMRLSLIHI